jgi:O-antigen ligase
MMVHRPHQLAYPRTSQVLSFGVAPPRIIEYGFYGSLCYAILGPAFGFTAGFVGAGFLALLAAACIVWHGSQVIAVYRPIATPLLCGLSFVAIQMLLHRESILDEYVRAFVTWMLMLIVAYSLSLRLDFLRRFSCAALLIGIALLPFMKIAFDASGPGRAELERAVGLNNSNEFGAWFGFCALYFLVVGIETQRSSVRVVTWLVTAGCLFVVGLTVSRGALFAVAVAGLVAARRLLKRGFVPVLLLIISSGVIYNLGLLDRFIVAYEARASQETGRFMVWPVAIQRILDAPFTGVGVSHLGTYIPAKHREITPHNAFLFIALASGIFPIVFFLNYWWRTAQSALSVSVTPLSVAPFALPLCVYCFIIINTSNFPFMSACVVVTMSVVLSASDHWAMLRARRRHDQASKRRYLLSRQPTKQGIARELPWVLGRPSVR